MGTLLRACSVNPWSPFSKEIVRNREQGDSTEQRDFEGILSTSIRIMPIKPNKVYNPYQTKQGQCRMAEDDMDLALTI